MKGRIYSQLSKNNKPGEVILFFSSALFTSVSVNLKGRKMTRINEDKEEGEKKRTKCLLVLNKQV